MIKLIIFDLYGLILSSGYPDTSKYLAKKFGGDWRDYQAIIYKKYFNQAAVRQITQKQAWVLAAKELKLPISWQELRKIHYKLMTLDKRLVKLDKELNKKGYITLVLSKNTRSQLADNCKRFGIKKIFKNVINTWELNLPKASKKTLALVLKRFKVKPEEVIYADDQKANLVDAKEMGIKTIFVKNYQQFKKELDGYLSYDK
ncbi:HAD hydrolase-like protein [Patescibacteria group bacterium]|nr:HAD hydrolase-like protein [Patescibacteria group bacterium]